MPWEPLGLDLSRAELNELQWSRGWNAAENRRRCKSFPVSLV